MELTLDRVIGGPKFTTTDYTAERFTDLGAAIDWIELNMGKLEPGCYQLVYWRNQKGDVLRNFEVKADRDKSQTIAPMKDSSTGHTSFSGSPGEKEME